MAGRNPNSLPRQSEMWHYCLKANARRNLVSKGRNVWNLIAEVEAAQTESLGEVDRLKLAHGSKHSPFLEHIPDRFKVIFF